MNDKETKLDAMLADLAQSYERIAPPAEGLARLRRRMQAETSALSEADLQWLAAAGQISLKPAADREDDQPE